MTDYSHQHAELQFKSGETSLYPIQFSIYEQISQPFVVRVTARSLKYDVKLHEIIGLSAGIRVSGEGHEYFWTGVCNSVEMVHAEPTPGAASTYYLTIVPNLWLLSQRRGHRIYQDMTTPQIVEQLMGEWGIPYELKTEQEHAVLEYRVQYGESDLAFLSRLLEEAGIAYYFVTPAGKQRITKVVFQELPDRGDVVTLPYHDSPPETEVGSFVTKLHVGQYSSTGKATFRDFDFRRPDTVHKGEHVSAVSSEPEKTWEHYHYSPGGFLIETTGGGDTPHADDRSVARHDDAEGQKLTQSFLTAAQFKRRRVDFETNLMSLTPGAHFIVDGNPTHPRQDVTGQELLVVESQVIGNATGEFLLLGTAVYKKDPFRTPRVTKKPRIDGVQSAVVVGPKGREIYTDEHGRVRVRFHWDREGDFDHLRTCWLRVSQGWAGPGYGAVTLPRVGHEVLVEFFDGDPDQPLVTGRLYNQVSPFPYILPKHKTQSTWKTQSSPFEDGYFNEIMIDDQVKEELVYVQGQRNFMKLTKNNETRRIGNERIDVVGDHRLSVVKNVDAFHVGEQHLVQMVKEKDLKILEKEDPKLKPSATWIEVKDKKITLTTGNATIVLDGPDIIMQAQNGIRFSADQELKIKGGNVFLNCRAATAAEAQAKKQVDDKVHNPEDRTDVAILELLNKPREIETIEFTWGFQYTEPKPRKPPIGSRIAAGFKKLFGGKPEPPQHKLASGGS